MAKEPRQNKKQTQSIIKAVSFDNWTCLNDSIMGGSSYSKCLNSADGLDFTGTLIEEGGGFVSCRSNVFTPPLDFSIYRGLKIELDGGGRTLKLALFCSGSALGLANMVTRGMHWVAEVPTSLSGTTTSNVLFSTLKPTIRAKPIPIPFAFDSSSITQFQILYSKFGISGDLNSGFSPGQFKFLIRSISGLS